MELTLDIKEPIDHEAREEALELINKLYEQIVESQQKKLSGHQVTQLAEACKKASLAIYPVAGCYGMLVYVGMLRDNERLKLLTIEDGVSVNLKEKELWDLLYPYFSTKENIELMKLFDDRGLREYGYYEY